ncbi:MAG: phospholipase D-like domain-containing protein [Candidatus Ranarchaeia archaeon]
MISTNQIFKNRQFIGILFLSVFLVGFVIPVNGLNNSINNNGSIPDLEYSPFTTLQSFTGIVNATTFVSPDNSYDQLVNMLRRVKSSLYVEIFGIKSGWIVNEIHNLYNSNTSLDIKILLGNSSLGYSSYNKAVAKNLTDLGITVNYMDRVWANAHQKFVIIDNKTVIIQSGNWAETSFPIDGKKANREWSIAMENEDMAEYYLNVFDFDWGKSAPFKPAWWTGQNFTWNVVGSSYPRPFNASHFNENMTFTPVLSNDTSREAILFMINSATTTLDIQIPYVTSINDSGPIDEIYEAIINASERGVFVRFITEEGKKDNDWVAEKFEEHGIVVVWHDETWFTAQHNKGIITDGKMVLVCSINFSDDSVGENREAGVIIENDNVTAYFLDIYDYDWVIGDPVHNHNITLIWNPNIPTSDSSIAINASFRDFDNVDTTILGYQINSSSWTNVTMSNMTNDRDVFTFTLPAQSDMSNISIRVWANNTSDEWKSTIIHKISVRDSIGTKSIDTTTTTTTTTTTSIIPGIPDIVLFGVIAVAVIFGVIFKKDAIFPKKKKSTRKSKKKK